MKLKSIIVNAVAAVSVCGGSAQASVVFSQAPNTIGGPYSQFSQQIADDFSIAGGAIINQVKWWGDNYGGGSFGSFTIAFYTNNGAGPGTVLASNIVTPTFSDTGVIDGYGLHILEFTANIPNFTAAAGTTYFFSVMDNKPNQFTWAQSDVKPGQWVSYNGNQWVDIRGDRSGATAYSLLGNVPQQVPEPGSMFLIGVGIVGLGIAKARKWKAV